MRNLDYDLLHCSKEVSIYEK